MKTKGDFLSNAMVYKHKRNITTLLKSNILLIIISAVLLLGMMIGSFSVNICEDNNYYGISDYFKSYILFLNENDFFGVFLNSIFMFVLLIFINYILGLCVIGNFISIFIFFIFSFGVGSVSGFLYKIYSLNGVCFFSLIILPGLFLFTINYILSLKQSFCFSRELFKLVKSENSVSVNFKSYSIKFLIHFILSLIICLINTFFSYTFCGMFEF